MSELRPVPFGRLAARAVQELRTSDSIYGLGRRSFYLGDAAKDFSVSVHGRRAASPLGPAAGPHTQLAQNIVLAWLGGARVFELKTVQILDHLKLPRPCIDMRGPGWNVEWSQELSLSRSLEEYVKASMLIDLLEQTGLVAPKACYRARVFDLSVGYDLAGIRSEGVRGFIAGMKDAKRLVARLCEELPAEQRGLNFETRIADTVTVSTFHGCPPNEIERIAEFLMGPMGLSCTLKLNPTLLGQADVEGLLHEELGFTDIRVPDEAFAKDATWDQMTGFVGRLSEKAKSLGRGFGVKFCNTLVVENTGGFLPRSEKTAYLSGAPLHVLTVELARRFASEFRGRVPVSFSGGVNKTNFPDCVAAGLAPVTTCSDLLAPGGYGRLRGYMEELSRRMDVAGAKSVAELAAKSPGLDHYARQAAQDPRYRRAATAAPKKVGTRLELFDCLTCDKCLSACPNNANFTLAIPAGGELGLKRKHQIANFADLCNECGNCDVFCPEDGGPYRVKPRFFSTLESWRADKRDGFFAARENGSEVIYGRLFDGEFRLAVSPSGSEFTELEGRDEDLSVFHIMDCLLKAVLSKESVNYVNP